MLFPSRRSPHLCTDMFLAYAQRFLTYCSSAKPPKSERLVCVETFNRVVVLLETGTSAVMDLFFFLAIQVIGLEHIRALVDLVPTFWRGCRRKTSFKTNGSLSTSRNFVSKSIFRKNATMTHWQVVVLQHLVFSVIFLVCGCSHRT